LAAVRVPAPGSRGESLCVCVGADGGLEVASPAAGGRAAVAALRFHPSPLGLDWWLVPRHASLAINGVAPLPLAALEPGDLLSVGPAWWLVASLWEPEPGPAPAELAEKQCPVCGGALALAPVCQCPCGRYYHLESPGASPADDEVLNCYLAGPCGLCGRQPTLEPVLWPDPPDKLFSAEDGSTPARSAGRVERQTQ
jgi:hypothetical protein